MFHVLRSRKDTIHKVLSIATLMALVGALYAPGTVPSLALASDTAPIQGLHEDIAPQVNSDDPTQANVAFVADPAYGTGNVSARRKQAIPVEEVLSYGKHIWDGKNPFHQPVATTDYYGSGDVNLDGIVTHQDASLASEMANGSRVSSYRADVDGNQIVDSGDLALIHGALAGDALPAWWNRLNTRLQRNAWLDRILAIDPTNLHPYTYWWVCGNFANQLFLHGAFHRDDMFFSQYDGGQTWFNIPIYHVVPGMGHSINAILVGDNPLNFDDWRFVEPQNDSDVYPGMWDMPYGGDVAVFAPDNLYRGSNVHIVSFHVDETGWSLVNYNPDLLISRPVPPEENPNNQPDLWNPRIIPAENGFLLFDRTRDDMTHMTDIHLQNLPIDKTASGIPLTLSSQYSRLLDAYLAPNGLVHLLWKGKEDYLPGIFYGVLDPSTTSLKNVSRVNAEERLAHEGRLVVTPNGDVHIFWLDQSGYGLYPHEKGIYWTRWNGLDWQPPQNLTPGGGFINTDWGPENPNILYSIFDVAVSHEGELDLAWAEPREWQEDITAFVRHMHYAGNWGTPTIIESTASYTQYPLGVELAYDTQNTLHLVYWKGNHESPWGDLIHKTLDGVGWSSSEVVSSGANSGFPRMAAGRSGQVYLVWMRNDNHSFLPVWRTLKDDSWGDVQFLNVTPGTSAWYPSVEIMANGDLAFVWSSRSPDNVTIETQQIPQPAPIHLTVTSSADSGPGSLRWAITNLAPGGTIDFTFTEPTTITLTSGELVIDKDMSIEGPGAGVLTINGNNSERVFEVMSGANATIKLLAMTNGRANGLDEPIGGGAIRNAGSLSLDNSILTGNQALYGGAIRNQGTMTVTNSIFAANKTIDIGSRAAGDGGAIFNAGTLTVLDSHIGSGNQAQGGGGIANMGTLELNNVTLDNNLATLSGGAIENGDHGSVTVSNSRVVNNKALGDDPLHGGGAIRNFGGTVIISNKSEVSNNQAKIGGGIYNSKQSPAEVAEIVIDNSAVSTNQATIGGGIYNSAILDLMDCTIDGNQANLFASGGVGGGIYNTGTATIRGCILNGNSATGTGGGARGGGIYNDGTLTLIESTVNDNSAGSRVDYAGGGIYNGSGELTITGSTINDNRLTGNYLGDGGGGLYNATGNATLTNCTISGNRVSAGDPAGGIYSQGTLRLTNCTVVGNSGQLSGGIDGKATLKNTIVGNNMAYPGSGDCGSNAIITSEGYNLDSDGTCDLTGPGDLSGTDPLLGPLQDNGGPTFTHALLPGSPAIDAVDAAVCPPPQIDQRGVSRPQGPKCDIGAYEAPSHRPPTTTISIAGTLGNNGWYRSDIVVSLSATDNSGSGVLKTEYGFAANPDAGCSGPWYTYTAPIRGTLEGSGYLVFRSIDQAGNVEPCQKQFIGVDKTPPAIDVRSPQSMDYLHAATFEIRWKPFDKPSAIATDSATLDGQPVTNGQVVDLFFLKLGPHMVTIQATDNAGNSTTITIPFNIVADIDSLRAVTKRAYDLGWINKQSTYNSLDATLRMAKQSIDKGQYRTARRQLLLFIYQLRLYNGKSVNQQAYRLLRTDALYVLLHLP